MERLSGRDIKIAWAQTRDALELTFTIIGAIGTTTEPELKQATDEELIINWAPVAFHAKFFKAIRGISARWRVLGNGKLEVQVRKGQGVSGQWARPFEAKLPYVAKDWDKWEDEPDSDDAERAKALSSKPPDDKTLQKVADMASVYGGGGGGGAPDVSASTASSSAASPSGSSTAAPEAAKQATGGGIKGADELESEMAMRFFQAEPLWIQEAAPLQPEGDAASKGEGSDPEAGKVAVDVGDAAAAGEAAAAAAAAAVAAVDVSERGDGDQYGWLHDWVKFRMEQRMVTMALFWNEEAYETRLASARRLVDILRSSDDQTKALDGAIKGGDFGRLTLDTSVYNSVARPARWLESFTRMSGGQQVEVMARLFTALSLDEKKVVVATFM